MGKALEGLKWSPFWTTHIGCLKGCMEYLGSVATGAWVFGGTGHAFVINMHDEVCPSGPTAWKTFMIDELTPNLGCRREVVFAIKTQEDFAAKQSEAWEFVRRNIDDGIPCYGWELHVPEYYVISGYDDAGYLYQGCLADEGGGPKPWRELGDSGIGVLEVHAVKPCEPASPEATVKAALSAALRYAAGPAEWFFPRYAQGPEAFETWAGALEDGTAHDMGHRYNAQVWAECRAQGRDFLEQARDRLAGRADRTFEEAREHYGIVADRLASVARLHPFEDRKEERLQSGEAAVFVREAGLAEARGLEALREIVASL
jgi:hypothetical protein